MNSELENFPGNASAPDAELNVDDVALEAHGETILQKMQEKPLEEEKPSTPGSVEPEPPEQTSDDKQREYKSLEVKISTEPVILLETPDEKKRRGSKTLEIKKSAAPEDSLEVKKKESKSSEEKRRESKAEMTAKDSIRSLQSLRKRPSKEGDKDYFVRRKSQRSIKGAVGSIISFRRGSIAEYYDRQRAAKFMNTYKLDSEKPFNVDHVTTILEEVLVEALDNLAYDAEKAPKQAKWASSAIRAKVKEQEYDRYKILCIVTIGEKRSQDVYSMYRFLWDAERDRHASFVHENMSMFAVAMCFGLYYE